jgi:hypothetical protein
LNHSERAVAACTVVAKNYLSFARALARSFRQHHPEIPFFTLLADEVDGFFDPDAEPFRLIRLADLAIPRIERFRFHYAQQPLSYAATPYLLAHLLDRGFGRVIFFKQETLVLGDLAQLMETLDRASIVLTPHLLAPLSGPDRIPRELNILQSGVFNVGLLGVAATPTARRFLTWWQDRVYTHCRHAVPDGMHYEQRWLDLVPGFFDDVHVLRDPGFNVGHWNLPDRVVEVSQGGVRVDGQPGRVFRFSGYGPDDPRTVTKYNQRLTWDTVGPARGVFDRFRLALDQAGYHETKAWPYAYGAFDNGVPVPELARSIYLELGDEVETFGDPLQSSAPHSYFRWLDAPVDGARGGSGLGTISRLWHMVYSCQTRPSTRIPGSAGRRSRPVSELDDPVGRPRTSHSPPLSPPRVVRLP